MSVVYLVRQPVDQSADCHAFVDYGLAVEAAEIVGGWVEEEPILGADFVAQLRDEFADDVGGVDLAARARRLASALAGWLRSRLRSRRNV